MSRFAPVYRALGMILMLFGLTLLAPFGLSYAMDDGATRMFFLMFLLVLSCGCLLWYHYRRGRRELNVRDGVLLVVLVWVVLPAFSALPFMIHLGMTHTDAYFEATSGLTATGATIISGIDQLPHSINLWRHLLHWFGGMGLIVLHSGHKSKPFMRLMGTTCSLNWNEVGERERIFVIDPAHPIAKGLPAYFEVKHEEMYGEHFDVPTPDELVLSAWFQSGQIFRCGCVWRRGYGKVFYFQPGHETYPTYNENEYVRTVIRNAVRYVARPAGLNPRLDCPHVGELECVPDCDRIDH